MNLNSSLNKRNMTLNKQLPHSLRYVHFTVVYINLLLSKSQAALCLLFSFLLVMLIRLIDIYIYTIKVHCYVFNAC